MLGLKEGRKLTPEDFVLPHHYAWSNGQAGKILRGFLGEVGIDKDIVFHTLRACFATHMLAQGVKSGHRYENRWLERYKDFPDLCQAGWS